MENVLTNFVFVLDWVEPSCHELTFDQLVLCEVHRHVCCKDGADNLLSDLFEFLWREFRKNVELIFAQNLEKCRHVEAFENWLVIIPHGNLVLLFDVVSVVETKMTKVVTACCDDISHDVPLVKFTFLSELAWINHKVESLGKVGSVRLVVVLHLIVASLDFPPKWDKLLCGDRNVVEDTFNSKNVGNNG